MGRILRGPRDRGDQAEGGGPGGSAEAGAGGEGRGKRTERLAQRAPHLDARMGRDVVGDAKRSQVGLGADRGARAREAQIERAGAGEALPSLLGDVHRPDEERAAVANRIDGSEDAGEQLRVPAPVAHEGSLLTGGRTHAQSGHEAYGGADPIAEQGACAQLPCSDL